MSSHMKELQLDDDIKAAQYCCRLMCHDALNSQKKSNFCSLVSTPNRRSDLILPSLLIVKMNIKTKKQKATVYYDTCCFSSSSFTIESITL